MFDIVRRRKYDERRVLISSARVLDPQFDDSLICLSGAEQELLRNVCLYLRRQDTFVATYFEQHYLTPDRDAWDALQAVVAGLEEKLMGHPLLGLPEDATEYKSWTCTDTGPEYLEFTEVPADTVRYVDACVFQNSNKAESYVQLQLYLVGNYRPINRWDDPAIAHADGSFERLTLFAGQRLRFAFMSHDIGAVVRGICVAHDCLVPD